MSIVPIRVLFLGGLRDVAGLRQDSFDFPADARLGAVFAGLPVGRISAVPRFARIEIGETIVAIGSPRPGR